MRANSTMPLAPPPNIVVTIEIGNSGSTVRFEAADGAKLPLQGTLSSANLAGERDRLDTALETFRSKCMPSGNTTDWPAITEGIELLHATGRNLAYSLFRGNVKLREVENFCKTYAPRIQGRDISPMIEVIAQDQASVPIEIIPLFNFAPPGLITNLLDLEQAAGSFPGFTCVMKRSIGSSSHQRPKTLYANPKLPMKFFYHAGLANAGQEWKYLSSSERIEVDRPWPSGAISERGFVKELCDQLWDRSVMLEGQRGPAAEIYHFACHCNTSGDVSKSYFLELSWDASSSQRASIASLRDGFAERLRCAAANFEPELPLVFLNACGSSRITPAAVSSFPGFLIDEGFLGVIGTETRIPDAAASSFARAFYDTFLDGVQLGEALLKARKRLLARANPIGILYTMYADPHTVIGVYKGGQNG